MTSWRVHDNNEINILPCWYVFLGIFPRNLCYVIIREYKIYDIGTRTCNKSMNSFPGVTRDVLVLFWYYAHLLNIEFDFNRERWRAPLNAVKKTSSSIKCGEFLD